MGSTEEPSKSNSSLYDYSSPSEPLLSKPPFSSSIEEASRPDPDESDPTQYLQISYNDGPRPFKDVPFLILFALFLLSTFAFGIFSIFHSNSNFSNRSSFVYDSNSTSCVKSDEFADTPLYFNLSSSGFWRALIWCLVITLILSVPMCFALLLLLKHYTKQIVYMSLPFFIVIPTFFDIYWFVACTVSSSCSESLPMVYRILVMVFVLVLIGIILWIFVANWHRIELTVRIIGVAAYALSKNLGLFVALPLLSLGLVAYYGPIVVFLVYAKQNGKIAAKESSGGGSYSCVWKQDSWVPAYYTLGIVTMVWSLTWMIEAQVYVISGTIAQWYFSKEPSSKRGGIRRSLRNAFGPSCGTICVSGLLIGVVRVVRCAVDSARQGENVGGIVNFVLKCCVNTLLTAIDFLNKFTINFAAITGESYCTCSRMTYELLQRNLLSPVFVETVSTRLLAGIAFVFSAIYAILVFAILKGVSKLGVDSYSVAVLTWVVLIVVLSFFMHVLDDVIDTVYICYAIDRDRGEVFKADVHEVYVNLPINRSHNIPPRTAVV